MMNNKNDETQNNPTYKISDRLKGFVPLSSDPNDLTKEDVDKIFDPERVRTFIKELYRLVNQKDDGHPN